MNRRITLLVVLVLVVGLTQIALGAESQYSYRIGPKDLVEIEVFEVPELNVKQYVSEQGTIHLPLLGELSAQGLTENELALQLKTMLEAKYVHEASVSVQLREFHSKPILVIGAVRRPGPLAFSGRWTLIEALAAAGGLTDNHGDVLYVLRQNDNGLSDQLQIRLEDLMLRANPVFNIPLFARDLINVPAPVEVTVFCLGEVKRPGALRFRSNERITLLTAIARAGGLTERASRRIVIRRRDNAGRDMEITARYKRILSGKQPDVKLQLNDVIIVKESFF